MFQLFVLTVIKNLKQILKYKNIALKNVKIKKQQKNLDNQKNIKLKKNVNIAEKFLLNQNIRQENIVQINVKNKRIENVYDIEVSDNHEYFANNILVHNCSDSLDYLICEYFKDEFNRYQNKTQRQKIIW